jgi:hypothetical protein
LKLLAAVSLADVAKAVVAVALVVAFQTSGVLVVA